MDGSFLNQLTDLSHKIIVFHSNDEAIEEGAASYAVVFVWGLGQCCIKL